MVTKAFHLVIFRPALRPDEFFFLTDPKYNFFETSHAIKFLILLTEFGSLRYVNLGGNPPEWMSAFSFLIKNTSARQTYSQSRCG